MLLVIGFNIIRPPRLFAWTAR